MGIKGWESEKKLENSFRDCKTISDTFEYKTKMFDEVINSEFAFIFGIILNKKLRTSKQDTKYKMHLDSAEFPSFSV